MIKNHVAPLCFLLLLSGSNLAGQSAPPVPSAYQDLYNALDQDVADFAGTVNSSWNGSPYPVAFSGQLLLANSIQGSTLLQPGYYPVVLEELNELKALGATAAAVHIDFPFLYPDYYQNPADFQQYLNFYIQLAADIRSRGMKMIIESQVAVTNGYVSSINLAPYFSTLTLDQYEQGRAQQAAIIAQQIAPDFLSVINEPDTEATQSGQSSLGTASGSLDLLNTILTAVHQSPTPGVMIGAGVGNWLSGYQTFIQNYAAAGVDYIDIHVYVANYGCLNNVTSIATQAHSYGKPVAISEAWLYKIRDSELGTQGFMDTFARDPFSFWAPLDSAFLQALINFSQYQQLQFVAPFWTRYFHSYLDYDSVSSLSSADIISAAETQGSLAVQAAQFTSTGSGYGRMITVPADQTPPTIPSGLSVSGLSTSVIQVSWNASGDNVGVAGYQVYRNGSPLLTTGATSFYDQGLPPATTYTYTVAAYDGAGNMSAFSSPVNGATLAPPDTQAPSTPVALSAQATWSQVSLSWPPSTDNVGVAGYIIFKGTQAASLGMIASTPTATFVDSNVAPASTYYYAIQAYDAAGNKSGQSPVLAVTTAAVPPPSTPTNLSAPFVSCTQINLSWSASTGVQAISGYVVYRGTSTSGLTAIGKSTATSYTVATAPALTYYFAVAAYDASGHLSQQSAAIKVTSPPDTTPPTVPTGLQATSVSSSSVSLLWSAATDNVKVSGYAVYRGASASTLKARAKVTSGSSYTDGVSSHTTYYYAVQSYDSSGNRSALSPAIKVTTP